MPSPQPAFTPTSAILRRFAGQAATTVALPVGRAIFSLALLFLYYGVFTPVGFLLRLLGRDALALRNRPNQATYWTPKAENDGLRPP